MKVLCLQLQSFKKATVIDLKTRVKRFGKRSNESAMCEMIRGILGRVASCDVTCLCVM